MSIPMAGYNSCGPVTRLRRTRRILRARRSHKRSSTRLHPKLAFAVQTSRVVPCCNGRYSLTARMQIIQEKTAFRGGYMKRVGFQLKVKQELIDEYKKRHQGV